MRPACRETVNARLTAIARQHKDPDRRGEADVLIAALVDFGGQPAAANNWAMGQAIAPKSGGFAAISSAYAADMPMGSCENDKPRQSGEVFNLAFQPRLSCATNQAAVVIPCHRAVGSSGAMTGYRWGVARKERLLAEERRRSST